MNAEELAAIRERDAAMPVTGNAITKQYGRNGGGTAIRDRRALLAYLDELTVAVRGVDGYDFAGGPGCDEGCDVVSRPSTLEEVIVAYDHWRNHGFLSGCAHGS